MRKITAIICSVMFAVFGVGLAMNSDKVTNPNALYAAPLMAQTQQDLKMPLGLSTDQEQPHQIEAPQPSVDVDSLHSRIKELEGVVKATKLRAKNVKRKGANRTRGDTIYVDRPVYYLATKTGSEDNQPVVEYYEVTKLDSIPQ